MFIKTLILLILGFANYTFANPEYPGGGLTHPNVSAGGFNTPGPNIELENDQKFAVGNSLFRSAWVTAPSSTTARDGLGPTFNAVSCAACHVQDGRGIGYIKPSSGIEKINLSLLFRLSEINKDGSITQTEDYGDQFNPLSIDRVPAEGKVSVVFSIKKDVFSDGEFYELRKPEFVFENLTFKKFDNDILISPRVAPHMIGLGLVEAIDESDILKQQDIDDKDQDGISGKANRVWSEVNQTFLLGRFGWKANQATLKDQNAAAFLGDIGLTTSIFPHQNCPLVQRECSDAIMGGVPEVSDLILDRVTVYTQMLGVPIRRDFDLLDVIQGEKTFHKIGCVNCHTPSFTTGVKHSIISLRNQIIYPYSDFLLHDMGDDLADNRPDGLASGREWRTPPLWGIGLFPKVSKHQNLLHDARARGVQEAILWHGGEAMASRDEYKKLNKLDRENIVKFVNSL
jgi:CxxC motif-containing protein (DUF1111 family)